MDYSKKEVQEKLEEVNEWVNYLEERLGYALEEQEYWKNKIKELREEGMYE